MLSMRLLQLLLLLLLLVVVQQALLQWRQRQKMRYCPLTAFWEVFAREIAADQEIAWS